MGPTQPGQAKTAPGARQTTRTASPLVAPTARLSVEAPHAAVAGGVCLGGQRWGAGLARGQPGKVMPMVSRGTVARRVDKQPRLCAAQARLQLQLHLHRQPTAQPTAASNAASTAGKGRCLAANRRPWLRPRRRRPGARQAEPRHHHRGAGRRPLLRDRLRRAAGSVVQDEPPALHDPAGGCAQRDGLGLRWRGWPDTASRRTGQVNTDEACSPSSAPSTP